MHSELKLESREKSKAWRINVSVSLKFRDWKLSPEPAARAHTSL